VIRVAAPDRPRLAETAHELAALGPRLDGADDGLASLLLVGLVRSRVPVGVVDARDFVAAAPTSHADALVIGERLATADEDRIALDAAVKKDDAFFATFFASSYSKHLARLAARVGLTPNAVTLISLALGLAAAASFALGNRAGLVAGAVLLQASFTVDCVDGQLARYTHTYSSLGAWLDVVFDRTKEILVYAALAVGSVRGFDDEVWLPAAVALTLLTVRHLADFAYVAAERERAAATTPPPLAEPDDGLAPGAEASTGAPAGRLLAAARRSGLPKWLHRIVRFPVGERLFVISVVAAVSTPRAALTAYVVWASVAGAYTLLARLAAADRRTGRLIRAALG
jgi:phosphatidylglycerophosphate synthase